jgi:hypothetical protein
MCARVESWFEPCTPDSGSEYGSPCQSPCPCPGDLDEGSIGEVSTEDDDEQIGDSSSQSEVTEQNEAQIDTLRNSLAGPLCLPLSIVSDHSQIIGGKAKDTGKQPENLVSEEMFS